MDLNFQIADKVGLSAFTYFDQQIERHVKLSVVDEAGDSRAVVLFGFAMLEYGIEHILIVFVSDRPHALLSIPNTLVALHGTSYTFMRFLRYSSLLMALYGTSMPTLLVPINKKVTETLAELLEPWLALE